VFVWCIDLFKSWASERGSRGAIHTTTHISTDTATYTVPEPERESSCDAVHTTVHRKIHAAKHTAKHTATHAIPEPPRETSAGYYKFDNVWLFSHEWVISHMDESSLIWMSHVSYKSVMPHMNGSVLIWMRHFLSHMNESFLITVWADIFLSFLSVFLGWWTPTNRWTKWAPN